MEKRLAVPPKHGPENEKRLAGGEAQYSTEILYRSCDANQIKKFVARKREGAKLAPSKSPTTENYGTPPGTCSTCQRVIECHF